MGRGQVLCKNVNRFVSIILLLALTVSLSSCFRTKSSKSVDTCSQEATAIIGLKPGSLKRAKADLDLQICASKYQVDINKSEVSSIDAARLVLYANIMDAIRFSEKNHVDSGQSNYEKTMVDKINRIIENLKDKGKKLSDAIDKYYNWGINHSDY